MTNMNEDEKYIDLHTHTTSSDGSMTPEELIRHAYSKGLAAVAITDHDTIGAVEQAIEEGNKIGIEVIAGVEISVDFSTELHLLGYFLNGGYEPILRMLKVLRKMREQRNSKVVNKLNELGVSISLDEVNSKAAGGIAGRPHIARTLVEKGYVEDMVDAFDKYLGVGKPAYFKKSKLTPREGIAEILRSGGIPAVAHPIYLDMTYEQLDSLLGELVGYGLMGIEAIYAGNTDEQTAQLLELAKKHHLLVTGGSDFHGSYKPDIEIGSGRGSLKVPYSVLTELRRAVQKPWVTGKTHELI